MFKISVLAIFLSTLFLIYSCSKKHHPGRTSTLKSNSSIVKNSDSLTAKKISNPKRKEPIPKVIAVNDSVALKSVDGRLYYNLLGHRYWKNYKDRRYYLFNQSMYTNDAFKKPD